MTHFGYQTNTMVYGMAGYRYLDFTRFGFRITVSALVVASPGDPPRVATPPVAVAGASSAA